MDPEDLTDEPMDLVAWYPDLMDGLTDEQVRQATRYLVGSYLDTGRRPEPEHVQDAVDVVTGRRTTSQVVEAALAQGRAWAAEQEQSS